MEFSGSLDQNTLKAKLTKHLTVDADGECLTLAPRENNIHTLQCNEYLLYFPKITKI